MLFLKSVGAEAGYPEARDVSLPVSPPASPPATAQPDCCAHSKEAGMCMGMPGRLGLRLLSSESDPAAIDPLRRHGCRDRQTLTSRAKWPRRVLSSCPLTYHDWPPPADSEPPAAGPGRQLAELERASLPSTQSELMTAHGRRSPVTLHAYPAVESATEAPVVNAVTGPGGKADQQLLEDNAHLPRPGQLVQMKF